jgi:hypothetical protein
MDLDTILPGGLPSVAVLIPGRELEPTPIVREGADVDHALPVSGVAEDCQELLGEMLDHLDVIVVDAELIVQSVDEMMWLRVVTAAHKPADSRSVDELVPAAVDFPSGRHRTVGPSGPSAWVSGVPCSRHLLLSSYLSPHHLHKGTMVDLSGFVPGGEVSG